MKAQARQLPPLAPLSSLKSCVALFDNKHTFFTRIIQKYLEGFFFFFFCKGTQCTVRLLPHTNYRFPGCITPAETLNESHDLQALDCNCQRTKSSLEERCLLRAIGVEPIALEADKLGLSSLIGTVTKIGLWFSFCTIQ